MAQKRHAVVVGLGGSLRSPSRSLSALEVALRAAEAAGANVHLFDLRRLDLPLFVPGADPPPAAVEYADAVFEADGLIWSSPMYHGTISGSFKNALDWLEVLAKREPPYLTDKVVGLTAVVGLVIEQVGEHVVERLGLRRAAARGVAQRLG